MTALRFAWWNVQDLAHFDVNRVGNKRWPSSIHAYREKMRRLENVLRNLSENDRLPQLLAFAEITDQAAHDLRDRLDPAYRVHSLAGLCAQPNFHVAVLYDPTAGFSNEDFISVSNVPGPTRPMATLDLASNGASIRFFLCHWTARFEENSQKWREICALSLSDAVYDYLRGPTADSDRHAVILGDLNEEPYGLPQRWLYAYRDRAPSTRPEHYTDRQAKRVRLYNCSWRLLGEQHAHPCAPAQRQMAGSFYWRDKKSWHTFDQVIVSGSLLTEQSPYLDEYSLRIASEAAVMPADSLGNDQLPHKFEWGGGHARGVSDHLPVCGRIILNQENTNVPT